MYKIDWGNLNIDLDADKKLVNMVNGSIIKRDKFIKAKKPKDIDMSEASYCPKKKPGQSWSYSKDKKEEEEVA